MRPEGGREILFGNSDLAELDLADPDDYSNQATEAFLDLTVEKVGTRFPGLDDASIASTYAGCYDVTPDFNPVISATPIESLIVAAGFSGHGFKLSPSVGGLVADLVLDGRSRIPDVPESDFRLSASPKVHHCAALTPMSVPARCGDPARLAEITNQCVVNIVPIAREQGLSVGVRHNGNGVVGGEWPRAFGQRPVFHHREDRIRAHIQPCWLALLLIRVIENARRNTRHELDRLHPATDHGRVGQRSALTPRHQATLAALQLPERPATTTSPPPAADPGGQTA